mgnify:CR=1 FL=1
MEAEKNENITVPDNADINNIKNINNIKDKKPRKSVAFLFCDFIKLKNAVITVGYSSLSFLKIMKV